MINVEELAASSHRADDINTGNGELGQQLPSRNMPSPHQVINAHHMLSQHSEELFRRMPKTTLTSSTKRFQLQFSPNRRKGSKASRGGKPSTKHQKGLSITNYKTNHNFFNHEGNFSGLAANQNKAESLISSKSCHNCMLKSVQANSAGKLGQRDCIPGSMPHDNPVLYATYSSVPWSAVMPLNTPHRPSLAPDSSLPPKLANQRNR